MPDTPQQLADAAMAAWHEARVARTLGDGPRLDAALAGLKQAILAFRDSARPEPADMRLKHAITARRLAPFLNRRAVA